MIEDYLRRQDGVITAAQARRCGLSEHAVLRRVRSKHWRRCGRGVYFVDDRPFTAAARVRAAVWSYGARAVASGLGAAWWHGLVNEPPEIVEVTVPRNSRGRCHAGTRVRRRDLKPSDVVERRGLLVTSLPLTAIEAAVRPGGGIAVMDTALQRHTDLPQLWRAHLNNKGRYGSPRARGMLRAADSGAKSHGERLFAELLTSAGITGWEANVPLGGYVVDFLFRAQNLVVEIDGWAFHSDVKTFQSDRRRQNHLSLLGLKILRFTWRDLVERPEYVITELRRALSAR
jgi:very-short-patch-repair endonuclease